MQQGAPSSLAAADITLRSICIMQTIEFETFVEMTEKYANLYSIFDCAPFVVLTLTL